MSSTALIFRFKRILLKMLNMPVADSSSEINSARFFSRDILGSGCTGVLTALCGLLALGAVSFTWLYGLAPAEVGRLVDVLVLFSLAALLVLGFAP